MDSTHRTEYNVRDLSTRAVVLFPTRAQISRDIKSVPLQPGTNEIVINGLSPTVDEHSIKVEGNGAAIITDIAVVSLPNRELFEDRYPESESDSEPEIEDGWQDDEDLARQNPEIKAAKDRLSALDRESARAREIIESAETRLSILDSYNKTLNDKNERTIQDSLSTYKNERAQIFQDRAAGQEKEGDLNIEISAATKHFTTLLSKVRKEKAKADKAKQAERRKEQLRRAERQKERERIRKERQAFWPKYCYSVQISLEANAFTPLSSRRASIASDIDLAKVPEDKPSDTVPSTCDLVLSYVTTSAYWSPNYDLQLSTTSSTGTLCFDAQLNNSTSETWEDCKVTLSTSQANFAGLEDAIPTLEPWLIRLAAKGRGVGYSSVLESREECSHQEAFKAQQKSAKVPKPRAEMFGIDTGTNSGHALVDYHTQLMLLEQQNRKRMMMARQEAGAPLQAPQAPQVPQMMGQMAMVQDQQMQGMIPTAANQMRTSYAPSASGAPPMRKKSAGVFGAAMASMPAPAAPIAPQSMGWGGAPRGPGASPNDAGVDDDEVYGGDDGTIIPGLETLDFQESLVEETGFTTSYDLPGLKTMVPKPTASKQRVAKIHFTNVAFSHTTVPKYKPVVYLKAKLRNNSKLTLLRGQAGLTLDGSFIGRTTLPRCSAGDSFTLSLGVDPAIRVMYPKPEVKRTTTGVFNKEDSSVYVRTMTLHNTRASNGKPIKVQVQDQIPLSEDERLKVPLVTPRGLSVGGSAVATGAPGREGNIDRDWGSAEARLAKAGQVTWDVNLNAGKAAKLVLEYAVSMPSGDHAEQC